MSIGAATLADIFDPSERGTMMGVYYAAPLLGPSLGPIIGGVLTQLLSWRATFWCMVIFMACCLFNFAVFFRDTFRLERSLTYQLALRRAQAHHHVRETEGKTSKRSSLSSATEASDHSCPPGAEKVTADPASSDLEAAAPPKPAPTPVNVENIKLSITDINPFPPLILILRRRNNTFILFASGEYF